MIYPRLLKEFGILVFFKFKSYGISGQISSLISSFLSNRQFQPILDGSLHKNLQLMLEFLKAPILVLYFSYYTLVTFLMMLSVILIYADATTL